MKFAFASRLPLLEPEEQPPIDSAVRVLLRDVESIGAGDAEDSIHCLNVAQTLHDLGYMRTALTYYAMGRRKKTQECLLLEQDGFARETHRILSFARSRRPHELGDLLVARNPNTLVTFAVAPGKENSRELFAKAPGLDDVFLYRELSTPASSGILEAVDRNFDLSIEQIRIRGEQNKFKPIRPLMKQPQKGQLELFIG